MGYGFRLQKLQPMTKITDAGFEITGQPYLHLRLFSALARGISQDIPATIPDADFLLINRNPGRAVSDRFSYAGRKATAAYRQRVSSFALLTRDMNRLAIQSYLLGAQMLGLENVVVAQGDRFSASDAEGVATVSDYSPTELISNISQMNQGKDFRRRNLDSPTEFCIGATVDTGQEPGRQAALAHRKVMAGASFLITQPVYDYRERTSRFMDAYAEQSGGPVPRANLLGAATAGSRQCCFRESVPARLQ